MESRPNDTNRGLIIEEMIKPDDGLMLLKVA